MRRTFVVVVAMTVGAVLAASAPALAKGEGQPVGAIITGPGLPGGGSGGPGGGGSNGSGGSGMGGPGAAMGTVHVRGADPMTPLETTPFWRLASLTGALIPCWGCGHYYDSPAPKDVGVLGPVYHVTYFAGECCARAVHQSILRRREPRHRPRGRAPRGGSRWPWSRSSRCWCSVRRSPGRSGPASWPSGRSR